MADPVVTVELKEFPILKALGSFGKVKKALAKEYGIAGRRVGINLAKEMRKVIRSGMAPPNSKLTIGFKGGKSKPLVGATPSRLFKAVTYKVSGVSDRNNVILVGVMRMHGMANVAKIVHEGASITVSKRMSLLFRTVIAASRGKGTVRSVRGQELLEEFKDNNVNAPNPGTELIIPPRPFAKVVMQSPKTRVLIINEYKAALARAIHALSK